MFAQGEKTAAGVGIPAPAGLERVPPPEVTGGLKWRNAAYALQWWIFGGFAAFMWFRMVREDAQRDEPLKETQSVNEIKDVEAAAQGARPSSR